MFHRFAFAATLVLASAASGQAAPLSFASSAPGPLAMLEPAPEAEPTRVLVDYSGQQPAGTVIVSTAERRLYFVLPGHRAIRYAVGVGREGFQWAGTQTITRKQEWPDWLPPSDMIRRRPDLPRFMAGGPENPLGARAMYLG